jgi:hypothetical protein
MPDDTKLENPPADPVEHNKEIAQKLAAQDISGQSTAAKDIDITPSLEALDNLAKQKDPAEIAKAEAARKEAEEKAAAEKLKDDPEAAKAAEQAAKEKAEREAALKQADDYFKDSPQLPANASPKSSEAFSSIKIRAAQEISKRTAENEALRKQVQELEEKTKNPLTPEVENELKELRNFRAKIDIEADPKWNEFNVQVKNAQEFIYAQLKKSPVVTDAVIKEIQKYGGPENVNLDKLFEAAKDPMMQRLVESKIAEIETAKFNKEQAIRSAKENVQQYVAERETQWKKAASAHTDSTLQVLQPLVKSLPWFTEKSVEAGADESAKKSVEEHNAFIKETREQLQEAIRDDSPQMRATLLIGMIQLFNLQRVHEATSAKLQAAEKALAEATEKLGRFNKASTTRLRDTNSPPSGSLPKPEKKDNFDVRASDALDSIAKQIMEEKAAKGA